MGQRPTPKETRIDAASSAEHPDLEVQAGAGAGKTSTLRYVAAAMPKRQGIALTYNKAIQLDMQKSFPRNIRATTAHALAWQNIIKPNDYLRARLEDEQRLPAKEVGQRLGLQTIDLGSKKVSPWQMARLVEEAVANFCRSDADKPMAEHMPLSDAYVAVTRTWVVRQEACAASLEVGLSPICRTSAYLGSSRVWGDPQERVGIRAAGEVR